MILYKFQNKVLPIIFSIISILFAGITIYFCCSYPEISNAVTIIITVSVLALIILSFLNYNKTSFKVGKIIAFVFFIAVIIVAGFNEYKLEFWTYNDGSVIKFLEYRYTCFFDELHDQVGYIGWVYLIVSALYILIYSMTCFLIKEDDAVLVGEKTERVKSEIEILSEERNRVQDDLNKLKFDYDNAKFKVENNHLNSEEDYFYEEEESIEKLSTSELIKYGFTVSNNSLIKKFKKNSLLYFYHFVLQIVSNIFFFLKPFFVASDFEVTNSLSNDKPIELLDSFKKIDKPIKFFQYFLYKFFVFVFIIAFVAGLGLLVTPVAYLFSFSYELVTVIVVIAIIFALCIIVYGLTTLFPLDYIYVNSKGSTIDIIKHSINSSKGKRLDYFIISLLFLLMYIMLGLILYLLITIIIDAGAYFLLFIPLVIILLVAPYLFLAYNSAKLRLIKQRK